MNKEKTKILTEKGDIYNSRPYIDKITGNMGRLFLISEQSNNTNIYKIKEYISDSVNQLKYMRDINEKLREELKEAKNEIESLQDEIKDLQDEITSNLENQIQYLQEEIEELKDLNNE